MLLSKASIVCPSENSLFYKKLFGTLRQFYTKTGGYHGKLIGENIYVVYKKNNIDDIVNIKIINYGTHVTFKSNIKECTSIKDIFRRINNEFSQNTELASKPNNERTFKNKERGFLHPVYGINKRVTTNPIENTYVKMYKSNHKPYTSNYETLKRALYPGMKHNFQRESKIKKVLV